MSPSIGAQKRVFSWAEELGMIDRNPATKVLKHKNPVRDYYLLSHEEEARLLEISEKSYSRHLKPAISLALHTGMRRDEVHGLEWARVNVDLEQITPERTKNGKLRRGPMDGTVVKLLGELCAREGWDWYVFENGSGRVASLRTAWLMARKTALKDAIRTLDRAPTSHNGATNAPPVAVEKTASL